MTTPFHNGLAAFGLAGTLALAAVPAEVSAADAPLPSSALPQGPLPGERVQPAISRAPSWSRRARGISTSRPASR